MTIKIGKKIKGYSVSKPEDKAASNQRAEVAAAAAQAPSAPQPEATEPRRADVIQMHEKVERPEVLIGSTYKIKSPLVEHAMYVTINDIVLNPGTEYELRRPFEVFINSKNMDHFQWIVALTRIMSAVFRKGGDVTFLVDEMKAVFDPRGGYFKAGGVYMPSIVAEIGAVVEDHLKMIGLLHDPELSDGQRALIAEKRTAYEARAKKNSEAGPGAAAAPATAGGEEARLQATGLRLDERQSATREGPAGWDGGARSSEDLAITGEGTTFPPSATMCHKCSTKAVVILDGCATCLNCGYSKCG